MMQKLILFFHIFHFHIAFRHFRITKEIHTLRNVQKSYTFLFARNSRNRNMKHYWNKIKKDILKRRKKNEFKEFKDRKNEELEEFEEFTDRKKNSSKEYWFEDRKEKKFKDRKENEPEDRKKTEFENKKENEFENRKRDEPEDRKKDENTEKRIRVNADKRKTNNRSKISCKWFEKVATEVELNFFNVIFIFIASCMFFVLFEISNIECYDVRKWRAELNCDCRFRENCWDFCCCCCCCCCHCCCCCYCCCDCDQNRNKNCDDDDVEFEYCSWRCLSLYRFKKNVIIIKYAHIGVRG